MTAVFRLSHAAEADIVSILAWTHEQFGVEARRRYEALFATAVHDAASFEGLGMSARPELGEGVFVWHLAHSRARSPGGRVGRPRHFLICQWESEVLVVGRVLHDSMDVRRRLDSPQIWD